MLCIGLLVMWCVIQQPKAAPAIDTFCQNYKPVYFSPNDTRPTKEQIDTNNRKWKRLCKPQ